MPSVHPLLAHLTPEGGLASALAAESPPEGALPDAPLLAALAAWAAEEAEPGAGPGKARLAGLLATWRQERSLESVVLAVAEAERRMRRALWRLGLPGPEWQAASEALGAFFAALGAEARRALTGVVAQNEQLREELGAFRRLSQASASDVPLPDYLQGAVAETARLLGCEFCALLLPQPEHRDVLAIRAAVAPKILTRALEGMTFPLAENGLIAQVFVTGAPASTYAPLEDLEITVRRRQTLESLGFTQLLAYPLRARGRVLGVLCVANRLDDQPWAAIDEAWLFAVASQLATAIALAAPGEVSPAPEAPDGSALYASFAQALALRAPAAARFGAAVGALASRLALRMGAPEAAAEEAGWAGRLSELGALVAPEGQARWLGATGAHRERQLQAERAAQALELFRPGDPLVPALFHRHERYDGHGEPAGLAGEDIPLASRLVAVASAFETLRRPEHAAVAGEGPAPDLDAQALAGVRHEAGRMLDPLAVQALAELVKEGVPLVALEASDEAEASLPEPAATATAAPSPAPPAGWAALTGELAAAEDEPAFASALWGALAWLAPTDSAALWRFAAGPGRWLPALSRELPEERPTLAEHGLEAYAAATRAPVFTDDYRSDARFGAPPKAFARHFKHAAALPLLCGERVVGVLALYRHPKHGAFSPAEQSALAAAAAVVALAWDALEARRRGARDRALDPLTGVFSHREIMERFGAELKRASRYALPLAALVADVRAFTDYNARNGYASGDVALQRFAELLLLQCRPGDALGRIGADSFAFLLPETTPAEARAFAERLREALYGLTVPSRLQGAEYLAADLGVTGHEADAPKPPSAEALAYDLAYALSLARHAGDAQPAFFAPPAAGAPPVAGAPPAAGAPPVAGAAPPAADAPAAAEDEPPAAEARP